MDYREYPPSATLARFVERIWTLTGQASELEGGSQPVFPDGRPELVVHFGDAFERLDRDGNAERQSRVLFAGQLTEQLTLRPTGAVAVLGVRFHAFGAPALFSIPLSRLTGLTPGVDDLSSPLAAALRGVQSRTGDVVAAVPLVQRAIEDCLRPVETDPRLCFVTSRILDTAGAVPIDALAAGAGMTRRHLERRFLDAVGISPKRLARIARFQKALRVLDHADPARRGVMTAATCGYADQSHFIRDFRELAGCSPSEHLMRNADLTGFFVTGARSSSQTE